MKGLPVNSVIIGGNLTDDAKFAKVGKAAYSKLSFSIANNVYFSGTEHVSYINVSVWGELADKLSGRLEKGTPVLIEGRLKSSVYTDRKDIRRTYTEVTASRVFRSDGNPATKEEEKPTQDPPPPSGGGTETDYEDDIPF